MIDVYHGYGTGLDTPPFGVMEWRSLFMGLINLFGNNQREHKTRALRLSIHISAREALDTELQTLFYKDS